MRIFFFFIKGTVGRDCDLSAAQVSKYILNKGQSKEGQSCAISKKRFFFFICFENPSALLDVDYCKKSPLSVSVSNCVTFFSCYLLVSLNA